MAAPRLTQVQLLAYAFPNTLSGMLLFPVISMLPGFYARNAGVSLSFIGTVLLVGRVLDAVIDPVIGVLSDRTRSRWGARKPWVLAGALLAIVPSYLIFNPGPAPAQPYVAALFLLIFTALAVQQIPLIAWSAEMTHSFQDRIRVNAYLGQAVQLGIFLMALAPSLFGTTQGGYTPAVVSAMGIGLCLVLPVSAALAVWLVPSGVATVRERPSLSALAEGMRRNRPLWIFMAGYMLCGFGVGINYGLFYTYADSYLNVASAYSSYLLIGTAVTIGIIPAWRFVAAHYGKHRTLAGAVVIQAAGALGMLALEPGPGSANGFIALSVLHSIAGGALAVIPGAIMGDIVDYDRVRQKGDSRAGSYFAVIAFLAKLNNAVGSGLGLILVGWFGYKPGQPNDALATAALKGACFVLPALLMIAGAAIIATYPLDRRRLAVIRRLLDRRDAAPAVS